MLRRGLKGPGAFRADESAATAVEFAFVALPFILFVLGLFQAGLYYMTQSSLDAGLVRMADSLRSSFTLASPTFPNASTVKAGIASGSGGLVKNDSTLSVDLRQLASLTGASVPVVDGTSDYGSTTSTLVLRAEATTAAFAPGFSGLLKVRSSALVRRQGR